MYFYSNFIFHLIFIYVIDRAKRQKAVITGDLRPMAETLQALLEASDNEKVYLTFLTFKVSVSKSVVREKISNGPLNTEEAKM